MRLRGWSVGVPPSINADDYQTSIMVLYEKQVDGTYREAWVTIYRLTNAAIMRALE